MRVGTRTLKVTAWLSAAIFMTMLTGFVSNVFGVNAFADTRHHHFMICFGAFHYLRLDIGWAHEVQGRAWRVTVDEWRPSAANIMSSQLPKISDTDPTSGLSEVRIPLWLPAAICLAIGLPAFVTLRRRARAIKNGACPKCGYVLTGLSLAAPCPECGRANTTVR